MSTTLAQIERHLNSPAFGQQRWLTLVLPVLSLVLVSAALVCVFAVVPDERIMGAVQRIFYFHVSAAIATYAGVAVLLAGSIFYLMRRQACWDHLAESGAVVALVFSTQVLLTGMIWGHSAWNVWWRWEPRLVSFLVLWLLLLGYYLLRRFSEADARQRNFAAVVGILAAVNVPIVIYSVKLLAASEQLHPQVVAKSGLRDASYVFTLCLAIAATTILAAWMTAVLMQLRALRDKLLGLERDRHSASGGLLHG